MALTYIMSDFLKSIMFTMPRCTGSPSYSWNVAIYFMTWDENLPMPWSYISSSKSDFWEQREV